MDSLVIAISLVFSGDFFVQDRFSRREISLGHIFSRSIRKEENELLAERRKARTDEEIDAINQRHEELILGKSSEELLRSLYGDQFQDDKGRAAEFKSLWSAPVMPASGANPAGGGAPAPTPAASTQAAVAGDCCLAYYNETGELVESLRRQEFELRKLLFRLPPQSTVVYGRWGAVSIQRVDDILSGTLRPIISYLETRKINLDRLPEREELTPFDSSSIPAVSLLRYLLAFSNYLNIEPDTFAHAAVLLLRFSDKTGVALTNYNEHRLFAAALRIADKFLNDEVFCNEAFARVASTRLQELNRLERVFLKGIDCDCSVNREKYDAIRNMSLTE